MFDQQGERTDIEQICSKSVSLADAAEKLNVSRGTAEYARKVLTSGEPALIHAVESEN